MSWLDGFYSSSDNSESRGHYTTFPDQMRLLAESQHLVAGIVRIYLFDNSYTFSGFGKS